MYTLSYFCILLYRYTICSNQYFRSSIADKQCSIDWLVRRVCYFTVVGTRCASSHALFERVLAVDAAQLHEGDDFELAHTFARDSQFFADLQQGAAASVADAVAQGDDAALARCEQGQGAV